METDYKALAETKGREAQELREQLRHQRRQRLSRIATQLGFLDPTDVFNLVSDDDADDDTLAQAALERLREQKPYLMGPPPAADRKPATRGRRQKTADDYLAMTEQQLSALPDEEFQKALRLLKAAGKL